MMLQGLVILRIEPNASIVRLWASLTLIALSYAQKSTLRDFLEYQLKQSVKPRAGNTNDFNNSADIWWFSAWIPGFLLALLWFDRLYYAADSFKCVALVMGLAYMWFFRGHLCYRPEKQSKSSSLFKIYRVFRVAMSNRKLDYPLSADEYHWKNITRTQRDSFAAQTAFSYSTETNCILELFGQSCP